MNLLGKTQYLAEEASLEYGVPASAGRNPQTGFVLADRLKPVLHAAATHELPSWFGFQALRRMIVLGAVPLVFSFTCCAEGWPMFRGSPGLQGIAEGTLATKLEKLWEFKTAD